MKHIAFSAGFGTPAILLLGFACLAQLGIAQRPQQKPHPTGPWMNTSLSPDERADLVMKEMTPDEKIALLHGVGMPTDEQPGATTCLMHTDETPTAGGVLRHDTIISFVDGKLRTSY